MDPLRKILGNGWRSSVSPLTTQGQLKVIQHLTQWKLRRNFLIRSYPIISHPVCFCPEHAIKGMNHAVRSSGILMVYTDGSPWIIQYELLFTLGVPESIAPIYVRILSSQIPWGRFPRLSRSPSRCCGKCRPLSAKNKQERRDRKRF